MQQQSCHLVHSMFPTDPNSANSPQQPTPSQCSANQSTWFQYHCMHHIQPTELHQSLALSMAEWAYTTGPPTELSNSIHDWPTLYTNEFTSHPALTTLTRDGDDPNQLPAPKTSDTTMLNPDTTEPTSRVDASSTTHMPHNQTPAFAQPCQQPCHQQSPHQDTLTLGTINPAPHQPNFECWCQQHAAIDTKQPPHPSSS